MEKYMIINMVTKDILGIFDDYDEADYAFNCYEETTDLDIVPFDINDIAEEYGLDLVETTTGNNGYPQALHYAVTGFKSAEELREVKAKYNLAAVELVRKEGHELWNRSRAGYVEPYDLTRVYDECSQFLDETGLQNAIISLGESIANGDLDIDDIADKVDLLKEVRDTLDCMGDDEFVVINGKNVDTYPQTAMSYEDDGTYHCYGLIFLK